MASQRQKAARDRLIQRGKSLYLWSGPLADFVQSPTTLTYSLLLSQFNQPDTLALAAQMIGMPLYPLKGDYMVDVFGRPYFDLVTEGQLFFGGSPAAFTEIDAYTKPVIQVRWDLAHLVPTLGGQLKYISWHTKLITSAQPASLAQGIMDRVDALVSSASEKPIWEDEFLSPMMACVIGVGLLDSTLHQYVESAVRPKYPSCWGELSSQVIHDSQGVDLYFQSFASMGEVAAGQMTLDQYMVQFGDRAFDDYELSSPRFREVPDKLSRIILTYTSSPPPVDQKGLVTSQLSSADRQLLEKAALIRAMRGTIRMKTLPIISSLRRSILQHAQEHTIPQDIVFYMTREELWSPNPHHYLPQAMSRQKEYQEDLQIHLTPLLTADSLTHLFDSEARPQTVLSGLSTQYIPISMGVVTGHVKHITSEMQSIPEGRWILVFTDASPRFSHLYTKGAGIVFLTGGVMSHGAIVAREYHKPAISLGGKSLSMPDGALVTLDATSGTLQIIQNR